MTTSQRDQSSVVLVGGHDAGKSNFVGRFWIALRKQDGLLRLPQDPAVIDYVESLARHLWRGEFAPRTDRDGLAREFEAPMLFSTGPRTGQEATLIVPDVAGELWENATKDRELETDWIKRIEACDGAVIFVRVGSKQNVPSLNWVTAARLMRAKAATRLLSAARDAVPTQIFLTDMMNLLERHLGRRSPSAGKPKIAIVVAAWDILPPDRQVMDPLAYLTEEYPMFAGRLADCSRVESRAFGVSIAGGDLENDVVHRTKYLEGDASKEGYVIYNAGSGSVVRIDDLTAPVAWALGAVLSETA